jgi:uncharacterized membrane protein
MNFLPVLLYCSLYAVLNVCGAAIIKKELLLIKLHSAMDYLYFLFRPFVMLGFSIILVSALVMFKALSESKFSLVSPVSTGVNFALTILVGVLFFEEQLSLYQYLGMVLIFLGITVITLAKQAA